MLCPGRWAADPDPDALRRYENLVAGRPASEGRQNHDGKISRAARATAGSQGARVRCPPTSGVQIEGIHHKAHSEESVRRADPKAGDRKEEDGFSGTATILDPGKAKRFQPRCPVRRQNSRKELLPKEGHRRSSRCGGERGKVCS